MNTYQQYIAASRYARFDHIKKRRETWNETVERLIDFWRGQSLPGIDEALLNEIRGSIVALEVMPSMRSLMTAGEALRRSPAAGYNCSFAAITGAGKEVSLWNKELEQLGFEEPIKVKLHSPIVFDELFFLLLNGCGTGFSVERQFVNEMPTVGKPLNRGIYRKTKANYPGVHREELSSFNVSKNTIYVADSKEGWASALRILIVELYNGNFDIKINVDLVRSAGMPLKVFGGRSSGPQALVKMMEEVRSVFKGASGRKLTSIEAHDVMCYIATAVICGGVRRCLPEYAPVATPTGFRCISSLDVGDKIQLGGNIVPISSIESTGEKPVIRINHRFGYFDCTPEHKVFIYSNDNYKILQEVMAGELKKGDRLVWDSYGYDGTVTSLPAFDEDIHFNSKLFSMPELNSNIAWLIGYIMGDGHIAPRMIEITKGVEQLDVLKHISSLFKKNFGLDAPIANGHGNCYRVRVSSAGLARWFKQHIKITGDNMRIPAFILKGTRENRGAFLAGLFDSDGRYRSEDNVLEQITTISSSFAQDIIDLLIGLGIGSSVDNISNQRRRDLGEQASDFVSIRIIGNTNKLHWVQRIGKYLISTKYSPTNDENNSVCDFSFKPSMIEYPKGWHDKGNITVSTAIQKHLIEEPLVYYPTPVISVEPIGTFPTYDIEVEELHAFTTSGIMVHNSAMISLSNLSDIRMRDAKTGSWWVEDGQRSLANNSVSYTEKPDVGTFMKEWISLYESKSGERGIFNRYVAQADAYAIGRDGAKVIGANPCMERHLRHNGLCNLSEVVVRPFDTLETLKQKVRIATLLGTLQATLTNFTYLSPLWKENAEEEALLGVSITGCMDHPVLNKVSDTAREWLRELRLYARIVNNGYAALIGINRAASITCNKPAGCRPGNALVTTVGGIYQLQEFDYSDREWTDLEIEGGQYGMITRSFVNGISPTLVIQLNFGMQLISTPNHQWFVQRKGWVRADQLCEDDQLVFNLSAYSKDVNAELVLPDLLKLPNQVYFEVNLPESMSPDFGWLMGYIYGDGAMCKDKGRFRFTDGNLRAITKARDLFKQLFNLEGNIRTLTDRKAYAMELSSRVLWKYFEVNGLLKPKVYDLYNIPLVIRKSSVETLCAFLAGLVDSDGCVSKINACSSQIIITTSQEKFAQHIQQVAMAFGQVFGLAKLTKRVGAFENSGPMYHLSHSWGQSTDNKELIYKHCVKAANTAMPLGSSRSRVYRIGLVKAVSIGEKVETFDIETEQHWFWAGSFMSHNTVSQLVDSSSGIHTRWSPYYIRRVRADEKDPLAIVMKEQGFPCEPDVVQPSTLVFSFPIKSPDGAVYRNDLTAIEQLEYWLMWKTEWTDDNPSCTIYVKETEWFSVGAWVFEHFDKITGLSFLPHSDHVYQQAPYEEITKEKYETLLAKLPTHIDYEALAKLEHEDMTTGSQEYACQAGGCDI